MKSLSLAAAKCFITSLLKFGMLCKFFSMGSTATIHFILECTRCRFEWRTLHTGERGKFEKIIPSKINKKKVIKGTYGSGILITKL
jgi:hypothetical protein